MDKITIIHGADYHVKNKDKNLYVSTDKSLSNIIQILKNEKADIYLIAGDIFDNAIPNESERKLVGKHIGEALNIETLKELVFINGNHDILVDKKQLDSNKSNNSFDSLNKFIETLAPELSEKITYLKYQKQYISKTNSQLGWIAYSLEDGMSNGNNIKWEEIDNSKFNISIYHDILVDYVEDTKLPVRKDKLEKLSKLSDFKTDLVLAGDIHKNYTKTHFNTETNKTTKFVYPGSTIQVNFAEGAYIKIRKNSTLNQADVKVVKKIDLEFVDNMINHEISDIELPSVINYITIDLNTNKTVDNFMESIEKTLNQCVYGENQTYIKLKLSIAYLNHELEIFKLVQDISNKKSSVTEIHTTYDKFVVASDGSSTDLTFGSIGENEEEDKILTIDDLKLDDVRLNELFTKVLTRHVATLTKEIGDDTIVNDIVENIKSLFAEQIELSLGSIPNYNIVFGTIETNNFMNLGANKIVLDIPGLTRIKGTNGIGKTTLYNMLRWLIEAMVFEGLKQNQKVKNTLLIFNDKMFNLDSVVVRLNFHVNGINVIATRSAYRKWKTNATDDIKKSPNWKDYIAEVTSTLKLSVASKDGQKDFTGEEAETLLKRWFGNVANTIMILNQQKILTMLNLPSDKLQQLVLDYIGVDYLNVLKDNLPSLKQHYNLQKPKVKIEDLRMEMVQQNRIKTEGGINQEKFEKELELVEKEIINFTKILGQYQVEQVNFGNIPELIKITSQNIDIETQLKNNFVTKQKTTLPIFDEIKPSEIDDNLNLNEIEKLTNNNEIEKLKINNLEFQLSEIKQQILLGIKNQDKLLTDKIKEDFDVLSNNFKTIFDENTITHDNIFQEINNGYKQTLEALVIKQTEKQTEVTTLNNIIINLENRNIDIANEMKSGVCDKCERAFDLENFEEHKIKLQSEVDSNLLLIENQKIALTSLKENKTKIDSFVTLYSEYNEKSLSKDYNYFYNIIDKLPEEIKNKIIIIKSVKELLTGLKNYYEKALSNDLSFFHNLIVEQIENDIKSVYFDFIKKQVDSIKSFQVLQIENTTLNNNILSDKIDELIKSPIETVKNYVSVFNQKIEIEETISSKKVIIDTLTKTINENKKVYFEKLQLYNENYQKHNIDVDKINKENELVDIHNKEFNNIETRLLQLGNDKLKYENNLPEYKELILNISLYEEKQKTKNIEKTNISNQSNQLDKDLLLVDEKLKQIDIDYKNYLEYQKHTYIYSLYDKLINKDFPDIVFEYYRQFLNSTLNTLLEEMNFKLYWHSSLDLYMVQIKNGQTTYRPVQLVSGMETTFLGLSLIYAIHTLNIKNSISNIFIDEISGQLNSGKELEQKVDVINFQEQLVLLLSKFNNKNIFIIDHVINNLFETHTYNVELNNIGTAVYKSN